RAFERAMQVNLDNIEKGIAGAGGRLLDLGCGDGERTMQFARAAQAASVTGVEVTDEHAAEAHARGIEVVRADLSERLPMDDGSFDVVLSNQVIEHLADTDTFVAECKRLVRPGGLCVCSTENLASWHNVAALTLGWQPFSLTNVSSMRLGIGNPIA